MEDEITVTIGRDDAGYVVVALREHCMKMRQFADSQTNIRAILNEACERIERVCERVEKELGDG